MNELGPGRGNEEAELMLMELERFLGCEPLIGPCFSEGGDLLCVSGAPCGLLGSGWGRRLAPLGANRLVLR